MQQHLLIWGRSQKETEQILEKVCAGHAPYRLDTQDTLSFGFAATDSLLTYEFSKARDKVIIVPDFGNILRAYNEAVKKKEKVSAADTVLHHIEKWLLARADKKLPVILLADDAAGDLLSKKKPDVWKRIKQHVVEIGPPPIVVPMSFYRYR